MSQGANPWSDFGCEQALRLTGAHLERAVRDVREYWGFMLEQGATYGTQNTQIWAPYYTLHKLLAGLLEGTIDCIATDHAPHAPHEKALEFELAPFGTTGLETALAERSRASTGISSMPCHS